MLFPSWFPPPRRPQPLRPTILECRELSFRYGVPWVLEDVTLSIAAGESTSLIGPNGGGKSTLLKLILGLLEPTRGSLRVFGEEPRAGRTRMGYVPQAIRFDHLFPVSALDIVLMGRLDRLGVGRFSPACRERALESLAAVQLADLAGRSFSDLSGGQRQRVLIARALASEPELLLLDEPTANIDLSVEAHFLDLLMELRETQTVLIVTHDLEIASEIGDSVLCVNHRVHRHALPLSGDLIREIYSGSQRLQHDRRSRRNQPRQIRPHDGVLRSRPDGTPDPLRAAGGNCLQPDLRHGGHIRGGPSHQLHGGSHCPQHPGRNRRRHLLRPHTGLGLAHSHGGSRGCGHPLGAAHRLGQSARQRTRRHHHRRHLGFRHGLRPPLHPLRTGKSRQSGELHLWEYPAYLAR